MFLQLQRIVPIIVKLKVGKIRLQNLLLDICG
nr:MAG TPA: hypothetical protein [Bacteriophage sp.]